MWKTLWGPVWTVCVGRMQGRFQGSPARAELRHRSKLLSHHGERTAPTHSMDTLSHSALIALFHNLLDTAERGVVTKLRSLIRSGIDVNRASGLVGNAVLQAACGAGHTACVRLLLEARAKVDVREKEMWLTALHAASAFAHHECIRLLLDAGATVDARDKEGCTPLHFASGNGRDVDGSNAEGRPECVRLLLGAGATQLASDYGETPLHWSCADGFVGCAGRPWLNGSRTRAL